MSKKKAASTDVCLNGYKLQEKDYLRILNPELNDYFFVKVLRVIAETDESQKVEFLVMKTSGGYKAASVFEYEIKKFVPEKEMIRATIWPFHNEGDELAMPDYMQSSIEEHVLDRTVEFLTPHALHDKAVRESVVIEFLKREHVIPSNITLETAKKLIGRAVALVPNRFTRGNGWIKLKHTRKSENVVTPQSIISTSKPVDKKLMLEGFVKLVESGLFGAIEWK